MAVGAQKEPVLCDLNRVAHHAHASQRMHHLFAEAAGIEDPELQAHFARYLCVLSSGFLEVSMRALFSQYARNLSAPYVANYVEEKLKDDGGPREDRLVSDHPNVWVTTRPN